MRAADFIDSEPMDETDGDSLSCVMSGEAYGEGDVVSSIVDRGDGLSCGSGADEVFDSRGVGPGVAAGVATRDGFIGRMGMVGTPGVGNGAGGWSLPLGSEVLM